MARRTQGATAGLLLALLAAALAGCLDAPPEAPPPPAPPPGPPPVPAALAFRAPAAAMTSCRDGLCYEPTLAIEPFGRAFVTHRGGTELVASDDGAVSFGTREPPPPPPGVPPGAVLGDALLQAAPGGRLHFSALVIVQGLLAGVQVASSGDGARTWDRNVLVAVGEGPAQPVVGTDRQWLAFDGPTTVYLAYAQAPGGIWLARSDDGGSAFGRAVPVVPLGERRLAGPAGPPDVDRRGRVALPYFAAVEARPGEVGASIVRVAVTEDRGATFRRADVHDLAPGEEPRAGSWPALAFDAVDALHVAWVDRAGALRLATSLDRGASFAPPWRVNAQDDGALLPPWIAAPEQGGLALAWYHSLGNGTHALRAARVDPARPEATARGDASPALRGSSPASDFAHLALAPDGRLVLVWSDGAGRALVGVEAT